MLGSSTRTAPIATTGKQQQQQQKRAEEAGMGDLFDHIDDLLDFDDAEAEDVLVMVEPCVDKTGAFLLPPLPPPPAPPAAPADGGFGSSAGEDSPLGCSSNRKPLDVLDIVEMEWAPDFLDDSVSFFLEDVDIDAIADNVDGEMPERKGADACFRTSSPVSVLEANTKCGGGGSGGGNGDSSSSSSSSSTSTSYLGSPPEPPSTGAPMIPARARSKRRRPATFSASSIITVPVAAAATFDPESSCQSFPPTPPMPAPKKRKSAKKSPSAAAEEEEEEDDEWGGSPHPTARKCMHCGIQKTPQWRAGPMGPKTLCNACGVRYKSGRLFPEYRPAASPTFVPSLHSNSHKKVVEMRNRENGGGASKTSSDGCNLLEYIRQRH